MRSDGFMAASSSLRLEHPMSLRRGSPYHGEVMGSRVETLYDVGVAGIHRLLGRHQQLTDAHVIVVVAGMDGVLPSVVGGLVECPVVAVPTSRGYGASFNGLAALLTMLNSCAAGVGVMNIDNGFGAGCLAHRINAFGMKQDRSR